VGRTYTNRRTGHVIMMMLAHGDSQTNDLQVHRPEVCYPAFGFKISHNGARDIELAPGVILPGRRLTASTSERVENILYWTRLGEFFPRSDREQQWDRVQTALEGKIYDGLLARFSMLNDRPDDATDIIAEFLRSFIGAASQTARPAFIGRRLTSRLQLSGV
jgi:EpsI family protein